MAEAPPPTSKSGGLSPPGLHSRLYTICDMMNETSIGKMMFSKVHNLIRLYLTVPMTYVTTEHPFSTLRQLKNYLQSTMTQE